MQGAPLVPLLVIVLVLGAVQPQAAAGNVDLLPPLIEDVESDGGSPSVGSPTVGVQTEPPDARLRMLAAALISVGVVGGAALNSFTDNPTGGFHVTQEHWFGENAYVGGGDKASHFVSFEIIARELATIYQYLGIPPMPARLGGFTVSLLTGLTIELADGTNQYGFSYEDLVMDALGAGTAVLTGSTGTQDLIGFRWGLVPGSVPPHRAEGMGRDYSHEIYAADLKLAGVARRLGVDFGSARFLLIGLTYGVKGYPYGAPNARERQLGFEIGLNLGEMLDAVHVHSDTWWGIATHVVFDNFRIPFTAGGAQYDLNHHAWRGPNTGNGCGSCK